MALRGPPPGAQPVYLDDGEICGYVALREFKPGGAYAGGIDAYRGAYAKPWKCFATVGEAELALRALRHPTGNDDLDWKPPGYR